MGSLFSNPLNNPLFVPTVIRIAALLAFGFAVAVAIERQKWGEIRTTSLFQKVFSWSLMAPTFLLAIFVGGPIGLAVVGFMIVQGSAEYIRLVGIARRYAWLLMVSGVLTLVFTGGLTEYFLFAPLAFFVVVMLVPILSGDVAGAHQQVTSSLFGFIYIPFFLSYLIFIKVLEPDGLEILLLIGVSLALSDVFAFIVGSTLKGPKLAPHVSPNKTWAGVAGNLVGAYLGWLLMWFAIPGEWGLTTRLLAPAVIGATALYGDLAQSFIKRDFAVKDAGDLLPGFGGLLDRIDSLLLTLPVSYYAIIITQHFTVGPRA